MDCGLGARRIDLLIPSHWPHTLATQGWQHAGGNQTYAFFERPGYWLRVSQCCNEWIATVCPEPYKVPRPGAAENNYFIRFADHEKAPEFKGRGSKARALEHAAKLWAEHEPLLEALGIRLDAVAAIQWSGTGSGGFMDAKTYRKADLGR